MSVKDMLLAAKVLAPLIQDVAVYLRGGEKPIWFRELPAKSRSQVEYEALIAIKSLQNG